MRYRIRVSKQSSMYVQTNDGVVTHATPSMLWAIGKDIDTVLCWANGKHMQWFASDKPPTAGMVTVPSDSQLAKKVSP